MSKVATTQVKEPGVIEVDTAYLHSAIMICGQTETTINKTRIKQLRSIHWTKEGFLIVSTAKHTHCIPAAAVKDSILVD